MAKDASSKKFLVSNFNSYKMVENRPIIDQFLELQRMYANMLNHEFKMDKLFIVSSIIEKFPATFDSLHNLIRYFDHLYIEL